MPIENKHTCQLIPNDSPKLKGSNRAGVTKSKDGSELLVFYWGTKEKTTKAVTKSKRYPTDRFSKAQAQKDCQRLGGTFEGAE